MTAQVPDRITIAPDKVHGQPCFRGLRFPVVSVLRMIAGGRTVDDIIIALSWGPVRWLACRLAVLLR